jgi:hypothetical protein
VAPLQVRNTTNWFNPCAFSLNPLGTFGNESQGALRGPHFQNWDMGLAKNVSLHESMCLQFQLEAFNAFNHPYWGQPNLTWNNGPPFGAITNATSPRLLQLSLALKFLVSDNHVTNSTRAIDGSEMDWVERAKLQSQVARNGSSWAYQAC